MVSAFTRSRWLAVAVMTATFVAGAMLGYALPRLLGREPLSAQEATPRLEQEGRRDRHSIFDQLDLTPAQQAKRDTILEKRRREMERFWAEYGPEMRSIVDSTRAEIDRMLTPEQRVKMQEFRDRRKQQREEWERSGGGRGHGPDGPVGPPPGGPPRSDGPDAKPRLLGPRGLRYA